MEGTASANGRLWEEKGLVYFLVQCDRCGAWRSKEQRRESGGRKDRDPGSAHVWSALK